MCVPYVDSTDTHKDTLSWRLQDTKEVTSYQKEKTALLQEMKEVEKFEMGDLSWLLQDSR